MAKKTAKKTKAKAVKTHTTGPNGTNGAAKRSDNGVERAKYLMQLPVKLEAEVVAAKADEMAAAYREREAALEQRRTAMAKFRDTLTGIDERMAALAETVEKHTELRSVEVCEYLNVETNGVDVVRTDTGEIVSNRAAEAEDRQEALFGSGKDDEPMDPTVDDEPDDTIDDPEGILASDAGDEASP